jgi:hypothetical protein
LVENYVIAPVITFKVERKACCAAERYTCCFGELEFLGECLEGEMAVTKAMEEYQDVGWLL